MKLHRKIPKALLKVFPMVGAVALAAAAFSGCVNDDSLCPEDQPGYNEANLVWLTLDITNQGPVHRTSNSTRAEVADNRSNEDMADHEEELSTSEENHIDSRDIEIILLNKNQRGVKRLTSTDFIMIPTAAEGNNNTYRITTQLNAAYFDLIGPGEEMWVLAIANKNGTGKTGEEIGENIWMMSATEISNLLRTFSFNPGEEVWKPNKNDKRIPMAGMVKTKAPTKTQMEEHKSGAFPPFDLLPDDAPLYLQRSMVKIQVIDMIPFQQERLDKITNIKNVTFCAGNSKGALMPNLSQFYRWQEQGTCVLEYATKPMKDDDWFDKSLKVNTQSSSTIVSMISEDDGKTTTNTCTQFICYAAEQRTVSRIGMEPYLEIVTEETPKTGGATITRTHQVKINDIISSTNLKDMVRNHIYRFEVWMSEKSNIEVKYTICPWAEMTNPDINFN